MALCQLVIILFVLLYQLSLIGCIILQVRGLEFNTLSPNLLASGADEGEICIWDIAKPTEPTHYPPLKVCRHSLLLISTSSKDMS